MTHRKRAQACIAVLAAVVVLSGCQSIRKAAGVEKDTPDEFAVVTKAPLVIPPDYNLRPPKPGAVPTNVTSPTGAAQAALYSSDDSTGTTATPSGPGTYSDGEKNILSQAGATNADHSIRQEIASDERSMQGSDSSFTDKVLFGGTTDNSDKPVNGDAAGATNANTPAAAGTPAATPAPAPADKPDDSASTKKKDSGWFSWLGL